MLSDQNVLLHIVYAIMGEYGWFKRQGHARLQHNSAIVVKRGLFGELKPDPMAASPYVEIPVQTSFLISLFDVTHHVTRPKPRP